MAARTVPLPGELDRVLEEGWLTIDAISGTSAGAMNAAVLASGFAEGRPQGARQALEALLAKDSDAARFSPFQRGPLDVMIGRWTLDHSPMFVTMDIVARVVSPYTSTPAGNNPLADILTEIIDFERVGGRSDEAVHHRHQRVRTGRGRVFRNDEITAARAARLGVPADTVPGARSRSTATEYWDGGYSGNPTMTPLMREAPRSTPSSSRSTRSSARPRHDGA